MIYAGFIDLPDWGVSLVPAKHEGLISLETWKKVIERLNGSAVAPARVDLHQDFPLRGIVACGGCGELMTAAWSKGRNKRYPYYVCQQRGCALRGKSIRKEAVEGDFEVLLRQLRPAPALLKAARVMLEDLWTARLAQAQSGAAHAKQEIAAIERKTEALVERLMNTDSPALISAYEGQVARLEEQKALLIEKAAAPSPAPRISFEAISRTALAFLANPWKLWESGSFKHQRLLLKLAFAGPLPYCKNEGYRTADLSLPFKLLEGLKTQKVRMVEGAGFEPT